MSQWDNNLYEIEFIFFFKESRIVRIVTLHVFVKRFNNLRMVLTPLCT